MGAIVKQLPGSSTGAEINQALEEDGVVIIENFFPETLIKALNEQLEPYIAESRTRVQNNM